MENNNQQQFSERILKQFNSSFDFKRLLGSILSNWYWFVLSITITLTAGFLYLRYTTPQYSVKSSVLIDENPETGASSVLSKLDPDKGNGAASTNLYNEMFILQSQDLIARVVDSLDLNIRYWAVGRVKETEVYNECPIRVVFDSGGFKGNKSEFIIKQVVEGQFEMKHDNVSERILYDSWTKRSFGRFKILYRTGPLVNRGYLQGTEFIVKIENPAVTNARVLHGFNVYPSDGRTSLLDLAYVDNIPQRGVDFLNVLISFYQKKELENINYAAQKTREFINERKATMIQDLKSMDSIEEGIKLDNDIVEPLEQTSAYLSERSTSEQKLNQLLTQKQSLANLKHSIMLNQNTVVAGIGVEDPFLAELIGKYNTGVQQLESQQKNLGPSNPYLLQTQSELASLRKRISDACDRVISSLNISMENTSRNAAEFTSKIRNVPTVDRNIKDVKRGYDVVQSIYLLLYQKGVENEISVFAATNKSKVVVVPFSSGAPISPIRKNVYAIAFLLGLLIPSSILITRELLNNKVINENDIESLTTIPVVGTISRVEGTENRENTIVVGPHVRTGVAEQFRLVRANLEFMSAAQNSRVFMITSSTSGEGKSFISINLGITMTLAKKRVIIMEFDLRKPKISAYLGLSNEGGISGYLAGMVELDGVIKSSGVHENLYIANCGPIPPNPGELLVLPTTRKLLNELQEMFDVVIIDTAPIGMVSDALILSQYAGINLFVVRQSYTIKDQVRMFDVLHKDGKIQNPAILFNGVEYLKKYGYGYGQGYGYGYSYGQGYGNTGSGYYEENPKAKKKKKKSLAGFFMK